MGQSTLNSFIVKKKVESKDVPDEIRDSDEAADGRDTENDADYHDDAGDDIQMDEADTSKQTVDRRASPTDSNLPPISSIPDIFTDLVSKIPEIKKVVERIQGRKLRVATMCSGTESPLLALEMIQESIQNLYSMKLDIEHVFSCEIEPFKQAYIERNFSPPILFRDICELGGDEAYVLSSCSRFNDHTNKIQNNCLRLTNACSGRCRPTHRRNVMCRLLHSQQ